MKCTAPLLVRQLFLYRRKFVPAKFTVSSQLPIGAGLGSSAAYSVAIAASILKAFDVIKVVSGSPSDEVCIFLVQDSFHVNPFPLQILKRSFNNIFSGAQNDQFLGVPSGGDLSWATIGNSQLDLHIWRRAALL